MGIGMTASVQAGGGRGTHDPMSLSSPEAVDQINQPLAQSALKASPKAIFQRVIQAHLFHSGAWTLAGSAQTPVTTARTIASLQPSFVTGLMRIPDHGELSNAEVEGFDTVRNATRAANKGCRFDLLVNAGNKTLGEHIIAHMTEVNARIHPDAWTLYIPPDDDDAMSADVFEEAISYAHSLNQMVGYNGPLSLIPEGVDYIIVRAWDLQVNRKQIELLHARRDVPIIVELPTTFGEHIPPEVATFVQKMTTPERAHTVTRLAENQGSWGYHFAYPIFYPLYPSGHAFDATRDNILIVTIRSLLARFN
jgi:hypothetical protein